MVGLDPVLRAVVAGSMFGSSLILPKPRVVCRWCPTERDALERALKRGLVTWRRIAPNLEETATTHWGWLALKVSDAVLGRPHDEPHIYGLRRVV